MTSLPPEPSEVIRHEARKTRIVIILCTAVLCSVLLGLALTTSVLLFRPVSSPPSDQPIVTPWMSFKDYQIEFKRQRANRFYPAWKEGRVKDGRSEYRAVFTPDRNPPFGFSSHTGMDKSTFLQKNSAITAGGSTLADFQVFTDENGIRRFQALWLSQRAFDLFTAPES